MYTNIYDNVLQIGQSRINVKEFLPMEDAKFAIGAIADKICALFSSGESDESAVIPVNIKTKHLEKLFEELQAAKIRLFPLNVPKNPWFC